MIHFDLPKQKSSIIKVLGVGGGGSNAVNYMSGLPEPMLLDAAHIIADKDEGLGQPIVPNGLPMSKLHHAAFDAHLLGIAPDFRLHGDGERMDRALQR